VSARQDERVPVWSWAFDVQTLSASEASECVVEMFAHVDALSACGVSAAAVRALVAGVRARYEQNAYHDFTHALDVTQAMCATLSGEHSSTRALRTSALERCALLVASLCHDCAHPGLTNSFLIATHAPLAARYCADTSVLEHHHVAVGMRTLRALQPSVLTQLPAHEQAVFEHLFETAILGTDMAKHGVRVLC
jgi:cAMP-specific phosphodiesterase 4